MEYKTDQENFWSGEFGNEYTGRNYSEQIIAGNINLFSKIISCTDNVKSILEFGANIGQNLIALKQLLPGLSFSAVEINKLAYKELSQKLWIKVHNTSILNFDPKEKHDFVLTKGLLIHINPDELQNVYKVLYDSSSRYICIVEYYNPKPVEIDYRGFSNRLFKRDFAGELLHKFNDLFLVNYGFSYHLDKNYPQDDLTWFLLEKKTNK